MHTVILSMRTENLVSFPFCQKWLFGDASQTSSSRFQQQQLLERCHLHPGGSWPRMSSILWTTYLWPFLKTLLAEGRLNIKMEILSSLSSAINGMLKYFKIMQEEISRSNQDIKLVFALTIVTEIFMYVSPCTLSYTNTCR